MQLTDDAQLLIAIREVYELSQRGLAKRLRVSPALINRIENGHKNISDALRIKLAINFPPDEEKITNAIKALRKVNFYTSIKSS
ncbi:helix-turn-helix transcriptional regulator [Aneurinibacillus aneurinilyticus]|uniref:helix-turn-helix transcriptional regulator n=1 Tax=Aneurinibacillus aneurinilyticus TaxID=1391 RepID=UPI00366A9FE9